MRRRKIADRIHWLGAVDWDRRLFDALIPLPDGTSYNAYLVEGSERTALLDTVDPSMEPVLLAQLEATTRVDYVVAHHAEQDHSGAIPMVLGRYPEAKVVCTPKAKGMLVEHLGLADDRFHVAEDGQELSLGDKTLKLIHAPWVHWPETMVSYLEPDGILFSCDFFGSHLATSELYATDEARVYEAAKRYYAEIMMPFRKPIERNLARLGSLAIRTIAPSHGPIYGRPAFILDAYRDWASGEPKNLVALPYVSMHGSTKKMVDALVAALVERGVGVQQIDLAGADLGKLAMALVDAATIVIGTPTVLGGPHPAAAYAAFLANAVRPKARFLSIVGSYGWGGKVVEALGALVPSLKVELLGPVLTRGLPTERDVAALVELASLIARRHEELCLRPIS
ncbi:MAG: FprA family A-type flavoprotein [Deltaproteobacteria bacterium]|nr:FprA family A-type flavoprotein [Deltaproteobacteria bacterium]